MQFLFACMKTDSEIDCDTTGRRLRLFLGHQITQVRHCASDWDSISKIVNVTQLDIFVETSGHFLARLVAKAPGKPKNVWWFLCLNLLRP